MRSGNLLGWVLLALAPLSAHAASLESIGRLAGDDDSEAVGVSADGSVVVGNSFDGVVPRAVVWTPGGGLEQLPPPLDRNLFAESISADGTSIVGSIQERDGTNEVIASEAFRWRAGTGVVGLGDAAGGASRSAAFACTPNGDLAVGRVSDAAGAKAGRWDGTTLSLVGPGDLTGGDVDGAAFDVSDDGAVIVGDSDATAGYTGFRWTQGGGMVPLGDLPGGIVETFVDGVSPDGSVIVGWSDGTDGVEAVRWVGGGAPQGLGDLPGGEFESYAFDVSSGGAAIVGESHTGSTESDYEAFLWDATNGMRRLSDVLAGLGVDTTGWTLERIFAISPDGQWVVGTGTTPEGDIEGFRAFLPEPAGAATSLAALLALGGLAARRRAAR
ncbi:MAG TPA: PEP-CTERM sorting domain-containing protein [Myxococcota bacterium]|nr:PEP-CTERM sorting domain-containing protein [Myxococcota bacterium]